MVFHLGRDPGERFPLSPAGKEYQAVVAVVAGLVQQHTQEMLPGTPQLEWSV